MQKESRRCIYLQAGRRRQQAEELHSRLRPVLPPAAVQLRVHTLESAKRHQANTVTDTTVLFDPVPQHSSLQRHHTQNERQEKLDLQCISVSRGGRTAELYGAGRHRYMGFNLSLGRQSCTAKQHRKGYTGMNNLSKSQYEQPMVKGKNQVSMQHLNSEGQPRGQRAAQRGHSSKGTGCTCNTVC